VDQKVENFSVDQNVENFISSLSVTRVICKTYI